MREYIIKVKNGGCRESELQELFDMCSKQGWLFDSISCAGSDSTFSQRIYIVFYREK